MYPLRLRSVGPELALKLGELEVGTALLDRDARRGRAVLSELGFPLPPHVRRTFGWRRVVFMFLDMCSALLRAAARCHVRAVGVVRSPRVENAVRVTWVWLVAGLQGLFVAGAMVAALTIAILLAAPPD